MTSQYVGPTRGTGVGRGWFKPPALSFCGKWIQRRDVEGMSHATKVLEYIREGGRYRLPARKDFNVHRRTVVAATMKRADHSFPTCRRATLGTLVTKNHSLSVIMGICFVVVCSRPPVISAYLSIEVHRDSDRGANEANEGTSSQHIVVFVFLRRLLRDG